MVDTSFLNRFGGTPQEAAQLYARTLAEFEDALAGCRDVWFTPAQPGKWSPAQQAEHVLKATTHHGAVLYLLRREAPVPDVPREVGRFHQGHPVSPSYLAPGDGLPWEALQASWADTHARLCSEIERLDTASGRALWHPFFGEIAALEWARMSVWHTRHHLRQLPAMARGQA